MSLGRFLTVDPGEDTGWAIWNGQHLEDASTTKMWEFSDDLWDAAISSVLGETPTFVPASDATKFANIGLVVVENWNLYPHIARTGALDFDECRTARLIGSIFAACRFSGWAYEQQPALIKERALAAGAESYFLTPLHENRHANDAIMHGVFRNALDAGAPWTNLSQRTWKEPSPSPSSAT